MTDLRVMSFNVRGSRHRDGENAWRKRAALNVRVIRRCSPDLLGFQELQPGNQRAYRAELPEYESRHGLAYENFWPHARNAVYWKPERLELRDSGGFWLSETPEKFSRSWGSSHVRCASWARFRLLPDGPELLHLNTHLDHESRRARAEASRLILGRIEKLAEGLPVVLTGDFNCDPGSGAYRLYEDSGFRDAHPEAGELPANTFHAFRGNGFKPKNSGREVRLDWVLLRDGSGAGWAVNSCSVVRDAEPPLYPSDHYPVLAGLTLEATAP